MTPRQACHLLGVGPTVQREQLRSAYRRMVTQWHPDRLEGSSEQDLTFATERMAEINLAYRLLLQGLSLNAA
jgi:DnaJ like chaperone protein